MVIKSALKIFGKSAFTTVVVPMADFIFLGETDGEKFRRHKFYPRENEESLSAIFEKARADGYGRRFFLAASFLSVRLESARYPDMTEEELRETLSWETDRLFRTEEELSVGYRVLSHTPEGYEILAAALPRAEFERWETAAKKSNRRIAAAFPLSCLLGENKNTVTAVVGKESARFYAWEKGRLLGHKRISTKDAAETVREFLSKFSTSSVEYFPDENCGEEEYQFWQTRLSNEEKIKTRKEAAFLIGARLARKDTGPNMAALGKQDIFNVERKPLRLLQGACAAAALCAALSGGRFYFAARDAEIEAGRAAELSETRIAMEKERAEEARREAMLKEAAPLFEKRQIEESFLVFLADSLPTGIVLTEIGKTETGFFIRGTASGFPALSNLEKNLAMLMELTGETEMLRDKESKLIRFTFRFTDKEAAHGS